MEQRILRECSGTKFKNISRFLSPPQIKYDNWMQQFQNSWEQHLVMLLLREMAHQDSPLHLHQDAVVVVELIQTTTTTTIHQDQEVTNNYI